MMIRNFFLNILVGLLRLLTHLTLRRYKPLIVGVTGNVGKTSTKEAIRTILASEKRVRASQKNFNNELGLPLTIIGDWHSTEGFLFWPSVLITAVFRIIFRKSDYPEILVLEYGIDRPGDMMHLLDIARPQIGVVTAIGEMPVHVEFFPSIDAVAKEKEKLIMHLPAIGSAILNGDDEKILTMKSKTRAQVLTCGFLKGADIRATNLEEFSFSEKGIPTRESFGVSFKLNYGGNFVPVKMRGVLGEGQVRAALSAAGVGLVLGINLVKIAEALSGFQSPTGRLSVLEGIKGSVLIDDTYNASPLSMKEALRTLFRLKAKRKIAVLGDMLELGRYTLEAHQEIGKISGKLTDVLITVGIRARAVAEAAVVSGMPRRSVYSFTETNEAARFLQSIIRAGDLVLIKASQGVRLEQITEEVMAHPEDAPKLLVRQTKTWKRRAGLYD